MTERQKRFCEFYAKNPNAAEAARLAGYSAHTARSIGQRLLTNADIAEYIETLSATLERDRIASVLEAKEILSGFLRDKSEKTNARIRAATTLLKTAGADLPARSSDSAEIKDDGEDVQIVLPWITGNNLVFNAVKMPDGEILRLNLPDDDTLIYISMDEWSRMQQDFNNKLEE